MLDKGLNGPANSLVTDTDLILDIDNSGSNSKTSNNVDTGIPLAKRPAINQATFHEVYQLTRPQQRGVLKSIGHAAKSKCSKCDNSFLWNQLKNRLPVFKWLPNYDFQNHLVSDMAGGLTVGILHIPQGMAYSLLANVPPVIGLYVSFFPVLIYFLMGSSLHMSVGSSTVVSLMVGKIINQRLKDYAPSLDVDVDFDDDDDDDDETTRPSNFTDGNDLDAYKIEVAATACFLVGLIQFTMGVLQLGTLSVYLSDMLISGFTTGSAVHSLTSQIKYLVGVSVQSRDGPLNLIYTYIDVFSNITNANIPTCIISAVSICCLVVVNEGINARFRHKMKIPVPIELIVIVAGTLASYMYEFNDEYEVKIVNKIPTGIPAPKLPRLTMMKDMIPDTIAIAVVVFSLSISVSKLLAKRHKYEVNATQELLAFGTSNVVGSFFSCLPSCASISRSLVQEVAGGKTQLASLVSCVLLLIVLLVIAPFFATLPNCVLAAIIVVALKGMFKQVLDFQRAWKVSKLDAAVWAVTFFSVVLVDMEVGLGVGIIFSLTTVLVRTKKPRTLVMGCVPYTDVYLDVKKFKAAKEIEGVKILHFGGALYFANKDHFRTDVYKKAFNPQAVAATQKKALNKQEKERQEAAKRARSVQENLHGVSGITFNNNLYLTNQSEETKVASIAQFLCYAGATLNIRTIVLDCSAISFIDASGLAALHQLLLAFEEVRVRLFLADCQDNVMEKLEKTEFYTMAKGNIFPTIHDAVIYALFGENLSGVCKDDGSKQNTQQQQQQQQVELPKYKADIEKGEETVADVPHKHAYVNMSFVEHL